MILKSNRVLLCLFSLLVFSCSSSDRDDDVTTSASTDNAMAESFMNDAWKEVHAIILTDTVLNPQDTTEPREVCIDSVRGVPSVPVYPITFTIFYGNETCVDGWVRKGNLQATLTAPYTDSASVLTIGFDDYWVEEYRLSGTITITNNGLVNGLPQFQKVVTDGKVWKDGVGNSFTDIQYEANQFAVWGLGATTDTIPSDDELRITGTTSGRSSKGKNYTTFITEMLVSGTDCNWEKAGKYELKLGSLSDRIVNLGDGTCNNKLTIQINGSVQEVNY